MKGSVFAADNVLDWDADRPMVGNTITELDQRPLWPENLSAISSSETKGHNLANAGARPADRTEHDERIIENAGGSVIDSQDEVGGYPNLAQNTQELNIPTQNLRAWLRKQAKEVEA
ncbi:hypothetical protein [Halorussus halophilus]|uniref:hypothetical protein n=1 Tax=Halorussus halophilus TaxID=2650975 RepID=UPI00130110A1|nr:hypothetical protein [Halorussus halophilus]